VTLSKKQLSDKPNFMRYFYIWERDLLALANRHYDWRETANELGFTDAKIDSSWPHSDAGRHIRYMENPFRSNLVP
jgi:hypothetical protein